MTELAYWVLEALLILAALRSRRWALIVLAVSLPWSRRLPALPVPLLNFQNVICLTALASFAMHPVERDVKGGKIRYAIPIAILALFMTASFLNTALTFTPKLFWRLWDPYANVLNYKAAMNVLALYVFGCLAVRTREDLMAMAVAGVAGVTAESGYSAAEYLILHPGRVTGHMSEPNSLGAFLASGFAFLVAFALVFPRTHRLWKISVLGAASAAIALVGSLSRGSWIACVVGFVAVTAIINRKILIVGAVVLALGGLWLPQSMRARWHETFVASENENWRFREGKGGDSSALLGMINEKLEEEAATGELDANETRLDSSIQTRIVIWTVAFQMMADYPLGVGFGVFPWYVQYYNAAVLWKATHNIYLKVGAESGLPALLVFLYILVSFCRESLRVGRAAKDPLLRAFGYGMFGYLVAHMWNALTVDLFFQIDVNGQLWLLLGALVQAPMLMAERSAESDAPQTEPIAADKPLYELVR